MSALRAVGRWGTFAGAATVLVGAFSPWLHSGARTRTSFEAFSLIERLGFAPNGIIGLGLRIWPVAPLMVVAAAVLAWWGWDARSAIVGTVGGAYVLTVAAAIAQAPRRANVVIGGGPIVAAVGGAALVVSASLLAIGRAAPARRAARPGDRS